MMKVLGVRQQLGTCWRTSLGGAFVVETFIDDSSHLLLPRFLSICLVSFPVPFNYVSLYVAPAKRVMEETDDCLFL